MLDNVMGGHTIHLPTGKLMSIFNVAMKYKEEKIPTIIFAGKHYGGGSSRDWAAKGTYLLGVKAVIAQSFERIHKSNLIGMGILPCQFKKDGDFETLNITGKEIFSILNVDNAVAKKDFLILAVERNDTTDFIEIECCIDTECEREYFRFGGILPYVFKILSKQK